MTEWCRRTGASDCEGDLVGKRKCGFVLEVVTEHSFVLFAKRHIHNKKSCGDQRLLGQSWKEATDRLHFKELVYIFVIVIEERR